MNDLKVPISLFLFILIFSLSACERPIASQKRTYTEIVKKPAVADPQELPKSHPFLKMDSMGSTPPSDELMASVSQVALKWDKPQSWVEEKGTGMRIVTFRPADSQKMWECSIVSLGGEAGGLDANVTRWIGQIGLERLSPEDLKAFIAQQKVVQTTDQIPSAIIDFTTLQTNADPQASSMIATIIQYEDKTIFVKLSGTKTAVAENREDFINLIQSLSAVP